MAVSLCKRTNRSGSGVIVCCRRSIVLNDSTKQTPDSSLAKFFATSAAIFASFREPLFQLSHCLAATTGVIFA